MKRIALIGSTGSIGRQVCNVVRRRKDDFCIESLAANRDADAFLQQVLEWRPRYAALADREAGEKSRPLSPQGVDFDCGTEAALRAADYGDSALIAATGFAGLSYTLRAIQGKKNIALANKETLVCGGELVMPLIEKNGLDLAPIDSEHSAIWQALSFRLRAPFKRLIITASGGPFYAYTAEQLKDVTAKDALRHPTWQMGAKITIDSATLLNKGLEGIEAKRLYGCPLAKIHTVVQPESIIHSMVEFDDGAILAQMSYPTMELPIQLALTYAERFPCGVKEMDFVKLGSIRFLPLERKKFPCYDLALGAAEQGGNAPCVLNGAGEVAVRAFLQGRISFPAIAETIESALCRVPAGRADDYEALVAADALSRRCAADYIAKKEGA